MRALLCVALLALGASAGAPAATISVQPGAGFDDATPTLPVAGNTGLTRGAQRLIVFQRAAAIWAERLQSSIAIVVAADFSPLDCEPTGAVLGSAGPETFFLFTASPPPGAFEDRIYPIALFNALDGVDNTPSEPDIIAQFNSEIDNGCFNGGPWYYGLDDGTPPPSGVVPLLPVVLHEMAHGLGFLSLACDSDTDCGVCTNPSGCGDGIGNGDPIPPGARLSGFPDLFDLFLRDEETGKGWDVMTLAERGASLVNDPDLTWTGPQVNAETPVFQPGGGGLHATSGDMRMYAPDPAEPGSSVSHFSADAVAPNLLMEPALQSGVFADPDLAVALFRDIGWQTQAPVPDAVFSNGFEGLP